jgi:glycosyltransferase involved in cell wall biosynthesis
VVSGGWGGAPSRSTPGQASVALKVLFATMVDLGGTSGMNVATSHIIAALARDPRVRLTLLCPKPGSSQIIPGLAPVLRRARFVSGTGSGGVIWHIACQLRMYRLLRYLLADNGESVVVARLGPTLVAPPLVVRKSGLPYVLLVRGMVGRHLGLRGAIPGTKLFVGHVGRVNVAVASRVYAAYGAAKKWADQYRSDNQAETKVLHNAVDPDMFELRPAEEARRNLPLDLRPKDFVIGFVGSMKRRHGLESLVSAFSQFRNRRENGSRLLLVGDGPLRKDLEKLVTRLGLRSEVSFAGSVPHTAVPNYVAACDVLYGVVDPDAVSNPIKCYEYLACGRPVITSEDEAFGFVHDNDLGRTIRSLEPAEIAAAMEELRSVGERTRRAMGIRGRNYILEHHTWERFADVIISDAELLLAER